MDFIQGLIDAGSVSGSEWHIVTNDGSFDILNNCSGEVLFSILNDGSIGTVRTTPPIFSAYIVILM